MNDDTKTALLPSVRCSLKMRRDLEAIAANSITNSLGDHIRFAVEQYIYTTKQQSPQPDRDRQEHSLDPA